MLALAGAGALLPLASGAIAGNLETIDMPAPQVSSRNGALQVSPLSVAMSTDEKSSALRISNPSDGDVGVQLRVFAWSQESDGTIVYEPTDDVYASPSVIRIEARQIQHIHLVRKVPLAHESQHTYRVVIDEIPLSEDKSQTGIRTRVRISLPIFVQADALGPALIEPTIENGRLLLSNTGQRAVKVQDLSLQPDEQGEPIAVELGHGRYVLAGSTVEYALDRQIACSDQTQIRLTGEINQAPFEQMIDGRCN